MEQASIFCSLEAFSVDNVLETSLSVQSEQALVSCCLALIEDVSELSEREKVLVQLAKPIALTDGVLDGVRESIRSGADPLGDAFCALRSRAERRSLGAVYTPKVIVDSMIAWLAGHGAPTRVVDPGAGSGRFLLAAGQTFPMAHLVAVELDPLAALMTRAMLTVRGWKDRATVLVQDYREIALPQETGCTAFVGNPPYVRHHALGAEWKDWYAENLRRLGLQGSTLAGLHLHFFLKTKMLASTNDVGAFVTSAEWLDVNYGSALRKLFARDLGGESLHVLDPRVEAFPGTATTAAIACFRVGNRSDSVLMRAVESEPQLNGLSSGIAVPRATLSDSSKWSIIVRPSSRLRAGEVELGEYFRVHRGQVTGANDVWLASERSLTLPEQVKYPTVTKARDLLRVGEALEDQSELRQVIDLPADLSLFKSEERASIDEFLSWARSVGADQSYIARHRKAWWSVGLREPAAILCTYMARRPPQFTLNKCRARHINIAHGLYPRAPIPPDKLFRMTAWLNVNVQVSSGRTYAGGLTKFEPKEIERLHVPVLDAI